MLDLPECSLNIHDIRRDPIEMAMIGVVVSGVNIVIILAVPGDIIQGVLHLSDHFVCILIAFLLALGVAGLFELLDLHQVLNLLHLLFNFGEHVVVGAQTNLYEILLPG